MNKIYPFILVCVVLSSTVQSFAPTDFEKFEQAIVSSKIDRVRSLLKSYEVKISSRQEQKAFIEQLARIARAVAVDRKEKLSLNGNIITILTYSDHEKASDWALIGVGTLLVALGCSYVQEELSRSRNGIPACRSERNAYYQNLVFNSGIATIGLSFGAYVAFKGYQCTMQAKALKAAEEIELFLAEQAQNRSKA